MTKLKFKTKGFCGEQHTLDELIECGHCRKYRETWNAAIETAAKVADCLALTEYKDIDHKIRKLKI